MAFAISATSTAAEVPTMRVCFANESEDAIVVLGEQRMPGDKLIRIKTSPHIERGAEFCAEVLLDSDRPLKFSVHRASDDPPDSEWPAHSARCPNVIPGLDVKLVVAASGKDLTCAIRGPS